MILFYFILFSFTRFFLVGIPQQREPITAVPWRPDHNTGNSVPYSLGIVCGFFNVPGKKEKKNLENTEVSTIELNEMMSTNI